MVGQLRTDEHSVHRTICGVLINSGDFNHGCFLLVLQIPFKCQYTYLCLHFVSVVPLCIGLTLPWPFFFPSLRPVLMVQCYRQVSGRRKDLFCCFGSPVSVGSQGKGWGGSTTHLCLGLVWPLSCGHAPLLCPAIGLFLHCVLWHLMSPSIRNPFPLLFKCFIFLALNQHSDHTWPAPTLLTYVHIHVHSTKD